ncbi:hypothetical protein [Streptomyces mirabilis]|uniref:Uncharacterized protein n=1 Tax=Streptomyces mirabilis TaxID=68239 RepID=A0ABU3UE57_9ACTN|nr:hypothetical protein [Streptomyces mirabilis]MDU8992208.1 hypothetical protein [Streptomyces mirabilis]
MSVAGPVAQGVERRFTDAGERGVGPLGAFPEIPARPPGRDGEWCDLRT